RPDELRIKSTGCLSANWCLRWPRAERRKTRRPADRAADEVRTGHQSKDRKGPRYSHSTDLARSCRRGHRMMRRREFIALLSGAPAWPLAARAQKPTTKIPRIGWLVTGSPPSYRYSLAAFRDGLKALGYFEGQNIAIEYRWAEGNVSRLPE